MFQGSLDRGDHVLECLIDVRPLRYWPPILRRGQESPERQIVPVTGPQDDRDYLCLAAIMPFESPLHFAFKAVIRSDEIRAYKQKDHVRGVDVAIDGRSAFLTGGDTAIMPGVDQALPAEPRGMDLQLGAE